MLSEIFSDSFAHKQNFLTAIDTRIKMVLLFAAIILILLSGTWYIPLITGSLCIVLLLCIRIPIKIILLRLFAPLTVAAVIVLLGYRGGFLKGLLIASKVIGSTSVIIFLSMTTPVNAIFNAARWFRIPKIWVEIAVITYRYVFVLLEDAITIRDAQKIRLGYSSLSRSMRSLAELSGSLFIRAYDQSLRTYEAMQSRGYSHEKGDTND